MAQSDCAQDRNGSAQSGFGIIGGLNDESTEDRPSTS